MKKGCLRVPTRCHSYQPSAGNRQRCLASAARNAGLLAALSARALIIREPIFGSLAQCGTSPQRITRMLRTVRS